MVTEQYLSACIYHGYRGDWRTECISGLPGILLEDLYVPGSFNIKLSDRSIQEAIRSLRKCYKNAKSRPTHMCVIAGRLDAVMRDAKKEIYIVPFTSLKP